MIRDGKDFLFIEEENCVLVILIDEDFDNVVKYVLKLDILVSIKGDNENFFSYINFFFGFLWEYKVILKIFYFFYFFVVYWYIL